MSPQNEWTKAAVYVLEKFLEQKPKVNGCVVRKGKFRAQNWWTSETKVHREQLFFMVRLLRRWLNGVMRYVAEWLRRRRLLFSWKTGDIRATVIPHITLTRKCTPPLRDKWEERNVCDLRAGNHTSGGGSRNTNPRCLLLLYFLFDSIISLPENSRSTGSQFT